MSRGFIVSTAFKRYKLDIVDFLKYVTGLD